MTEVLKKLLTEPFNKFDLKSNFISFEEALYNLNKNYFLNKNYRELNGVYQLVNFENDKTNSIKNFIEQAYPNRFVDVELFLSLFNDADGLGTHKDVEMDNILQVHQGSVQVNIIHDKVYSVILKQGQAVFIKAGVKHRVVTTQPRILVSYGIYI
jgi:mannose-6-phosphate isomerase-like protein (cupin superfamily)|tara:strand:- start:2750 stop:3214 length:465 start_codon:yes stop_codon:yes gene_type:complete